MRRPVYSALICIMMSSSFTAGRWVLRMRQLQVMTAGGTESHTLKPASPGQVQ